jgi:hypothetical protein
MGFATLPSLGFFVTCAVSYPCIQLIFVKEKCCVFFVTVIDSLNVI